MQFDPNMQLDLLLALWRHWRHLQFYWWFFDGCSSASNASTCGGNCTWRTVPCMLSNYCMLTGSGSCSGNDASSCTSGGPQCTWAPQCQTTTPCGIPVDQASCVGTSGCYWSSGSSSFLGLTGPDGGCGDCFDDPSKSENHYLAVEAHLGQKCSINAGFLTASETVTFAVAAPTGCTGGIAAPMNPAMTCVNGDASTLSVAVVISLTIVTLFSV